MHGGLAEGKVRSKTDHFVVVLCLSGGRTLGWSAMVRKGKRQKGGKKSGSDRICCFGFVVPVTFVIVAVRFPSFSVCSRRVSDQMCGFG